MYKYNRRYVERSILPEKPRISPKEMALLIGMPLGEAIVIPEELKPGSKAELEDKPANRTEVGKSLLHYTSQ